MGKIALVEKFVSVQGEGANAGRRAIFIRYAGCNLDCVFADGSICDTPWRKAGEKLTLEELLTWIDQQCERFLLPDNPDHLTPEYLHAPMVILTGGEPAMAPSFDDLVIELKRRRLYVAIETNATIWRDQMVALDWIVASPKNAIDHAKPLHTPEPDPTVLRNAHEFRYVIGGLDDPVPPYRPHSGAVHFVSPALMADGTGKEWLEPEPPGFAPGAVERCMQIIAEDPRWKLSLQTHKWIRQR